MAWIVVERIEDYSRNYLKQMPVQFQISIFDYVLAGLFPWLAPIPFIWLFSVATILFDFIDKLWGIFPALRRVSYALLKTSIILGIPYLVYIWGYVLFAILGLITSH